MAKLDTSELEATRESIGKEYKDAVLKRNKVLEKYNVELAEIGSRFQEVDAKIKKIKAKQED